MKLQVEQAIQQAGTYFPFSFSVPAQELGDVQAFPWREEMVHVKGEYVYDGHRLVVTGTINTAGIYECCRCLTTVPLERNERFEERYVTNPEIDTEALVYDGVEITLTEVIRETLIISEPYQVVCQDDCKGLCIHCGANLNTSPCQCDTFVADPRLAVLQTLLKK